VDVARYAEVVRPLFEGRKVIFAGQVAAAFTPAATLARSLGAASMRSATRV